MSRPLRIQYENAWYHVMNRGASRKVIFHCDLHRKMFLELMAEINIDYDAAIHAYCLMDNHYHLLLQTPRGNLAQKKGVRHRQRTSSSITNGCQTSTALKIWKINGFEYIKNMFY